MTYDDLWKKITLDWDSIAWNEAYQRIKFIMNYRDDIEKIRIYASPNLDGYHVYIHFNYWIHWNEVIKLRQKFRDDPKRLINDLFKTNPDEKMILFSDKDGKKEIFITEYWPQPEFIWPKIIGFNDVS